MADIAFIPHQLTLFIQNLFKEKLKYVCNFFYFLTLGWQWQMGMFLIKDRPLFIIYLFNAMVTDDLVMDGTTASTAMILT